MPGGREDHVDGAVAEPQPLDQPHAAPGQGARQIVNRIALVVNVEAAPVVARVVRPLRLDLHREDAAADDGDAHLHPLVHVRLDDHGTVADGVDMSDIATGHELGQGVGDRVAGGAIGHEAVVEGLADDVAVVPAVEGEELLRAVGDERGRDLEAQPGGDLELQRLVAGSSLLPARRRQPQAVQQRGRSRPGLGGLLPDIVAQLWIRQHRIGGGRTGPTPPYGRHRAEVDQSAARGEGRPGAIGGARFERQPSPGRQIGEVEAGDDRAPTQLGYDGRDVLVVCRGDDRIMTGFSTSLGPGSIAVTRIFNAAQGGFTMDEQVIETATGLGYVEIVEGTGRGPRPATP